MLYGDPEEVPWSSSRERPPFPATILFCSILLWSFQLCCSLKNIFPEGECLHLQMCTA